jgi:hypothetical protein
MLPPRDIPEDVSRLIARRLESPQFLEVLLLMHGTPSRSWTPDEIAVRLQLDETSTSCALVALRRAGILKVAIADSLQYSYQPPPSTADTVDALAALYEERPGDIIDLIASRPRQKLRIFADAFRFRRDD